MSTLAEELRALLSGDVADDQATLDTYSTDASLFRVRPSLVVFPRDASDLAKLTAFIAERKKSDPALSLTVRAAGSDMSGGPLNESVIADVTKYMHRIGEVEGREIWVEPGAFYRDFEPKTLAQGLLLPCFPASKQLAALGGMIGNNGAGEKTLRYGKMENFILETKAIFSDGKEYIVRPLSETELKEKIAQGDFEGNVYKQLFELIESNKEAIRDARPNVTKNSAGYFLWNVCPSMTLGVKDGDYFFDLNKLLVGSQGTLGIITDAKLRLVPEKRVHDMVAIFFKSWDELPHVVNAVLPHEPESLETFDEDTLKLGIRFMPEIAKKAGTNLLSFAARFLPEAWIGIKMLGLPKLIILVEVAEDTEEEVKAKVTRITEALRPFDIFSRVIEKDSEEEKFWIMRRESFNLLRKHVKGKRTAPFIDDFCIPPDRVPEFLPKALAILKEHDIDANIAGHAGDGNFHIIPLMDMTKESEREKIPVVSEKFYDLVAQYHGSITAEHNDGIVRTPYLGKMYSPEVLELFRRTKEIFDPEYIFNPGKKVGGSVEYLKAHIAEK